MTARTLSRTVVFARPFSLSALDFMLPPGSYVVETEEELLQGLSFPAYQRTATWLRIPARAGSGAIDRVVNIAPEELEAALAADAAKPPSGPEEGGSGPC
jgi:hypothetical protein